MLREIKPTSDPESPAAPVGVTIDPAAAEDERLIRSAQSGNLEAFNDLVERHQRAVFNVCLRLLRDAGHAEDAAQDTFIRAWSALESFRGGLVRPWLLRIATNRAYDMLRSRARRPATSLDAELFESEPEWTPQSIHEHPEAHAARTELSIHLERALALLPDDQRVSIVLSDVQGYGYEEISQITGVAVGTVKSRISRGRSRLRESLNDNLDQRELFERFVRLTQQNANES